MISIKNIPPKKTSTNSDFTLRHYEQLCRLAVKKFSIARYTSVPWGSRFVLWRHDMDFSLNRGLALAKAEKKQRLHATYFLNPHSDFYNLAEAGQHKIITEIIALGHDIGLHFDFGFYGKKSKAQLIDLIAQEAAYLEQLFQVRPVALSFHNPVAFTFRLEADQYGGLINCYSKRFKTEVAYCSDSNGYWRFRRLYDVLNETKDPCLQVLTHPGWWQDKPMPPRQRIFRCVTGRARATMRKYDSDLAHNERLNHVGPSAVLAVLKKDLPQHFELCDYLWNQELFQTLYLELWRLHETQINRLCKAQLRKIARIPAAQVNALFGDNQLRIDGWKLFKAIFSDKWTNVIGLKVPIFLKYVKIRSQIIHAREHVSPNELEKGCIGICQFINRLAKWGKSQSLSYNGLAHLGSIGLPTIKKADGDLGEKLEEMESKIKNFPRNKWLKLKKKLTRRSDE